MTPIQKRLQKAFLNLQDVVDFQEGKRQRNKVVFAMKELDEAIKRETRRLKNKG